MSAAWVSSAHTYIKTSQLKTQKTTRYRLKRSTERETERDVTSVKKRRDAGVHVHVDEIKRRPNRILAG